jgi:SHS2 domain-containing protein
MMDDQVNLNGGWRFLNHTADIRLEVWGTSREKLFINAAKSLSTLLASAAEPTREERIEITIEGGEADELLVNWLREILFYSQTRRLVMTDIDILELSETSLKATLMGVRAQVGQETSLEIKGVTYHGSSIQKDDKGYTARIIFDI